MDNLSMTGCLFNRKNEKTPSGCEEPKKTEETPTSACPKPPVKSMTPSKMKPKSASNPCPKKNKKKKKMPRSRNPFIIFFLRLHQKDPKKRMSVVMREAGKQWCVMSCEEKLFYRKLAQTEQRRQRLKGKGRSKKKKGSKKMKRSCK